MTGALRYEWMRIRTIRSSYWMSALAIALTFGITLLMGLSISAADLDDEFDSVDQVTTYIVLAGASGPFIPVMAAPFYAVMGVMAVGHDEIGRASCRERV